MNSIVLVQFASTILLIISKCMAVTICCAKNTMLPLATQPILAAITQPALVPTCPAPYHRVNGLHKCYLFVQVDTSFSNAVADCESKQGTLMKVETEQERQWLLTLRGYYMGIWLGGIRYANSSIIWLDGTPVTHLPGCTDPISYYDGNYLNIAKDIFNCGATSNSGSFVFPYVCKRDFLMSI